MRLHWAKANVICNRLHCLTDLVENYPFMKVSALDRWHRTFFQSVMSLSRLKRKMPFPWDLAIGFIIHVCPGFFLNSSTNMWYSDWNKIKPSGILPHVARKLRYKLCFVVTIGKWLHSWGSFTAKESEIFLWCLSYFLFRFRSVWMNPYGSKLWWYMQIILITFVVTFGLIIYCKFFNILIRG